MASREVMRIAACLAVIAGLCVGLSSCSQRGPVGERVARNLDSDVTNWTGVPVKALFGDRERAEIHPSSGVDFQVSYLQLRLPRAVNKVRITGGGQGDRELDGMALDIIKAGDTGGPVSVPLRPAEAGQESAEDEIPLFMVNRATRPGIPREASQVRLQGLSSASSIGVGVRIWLGDYEFMVPLDTRRPENDVLTDILRNDPDLGARVSEALVEAGVSRSQVAQSVAAARRRLLLMNDFERWIFILGIDRGALASVTDIDGAAEMALGVLARQTYSPFKGTARSLSADHQRILVVPTKPGREPWSYNVIVFDEQGLIWHGIWASSKGQGPDRNMGLSLLLQLFGLNGAEAESSSSAMQGGLGPALDGTPAE